MSVVWGGGGGGETHFGWVQGTQLLSDPGKKRIGTLFRAWTILVGQPPKKKEKELEPLNRVGPPKGETSPKKVIRFE